MADQANSDAQAYQQPPEPSPDLKNLDRLVGRWVVSGGAQGRVSFEWMEGGFFLIQHVDLEQYGQRIKGIEIIGHERPFGEEPSEEIKSRFYSNMGDTLDYVYELEGDTLTIWAGGKGSPAYAKGTFSEGREAITQSFVETSMLKRVETLDDVGNLAAFAASDLARTMTATDINITAGRVAD